MRLNSEKTEGKMIRDQRSMAFTSVRSGILILSCEDRRRRRLRFIWADRSSEWRLVERGPTPPLCLRYWMCAEAVLSNCTMDWEFLMSATLVVISPPATSLWISKVVNSMFPWPCGSAWINKEERNLINKHYVQDATSRRTLAELLKHLPSVYSALRCSCHCGRLPNVPMGVTAPLDQGFNICVEGVCLNDNGEILNNYKDTQSDYKKIRNYKEIQNNYKDPDNHHILGLIQSVCILLATVQ